jgi:hypothetical protein
MTQYLKKSIELTLSIFSCGILNLFRNPADAMDYWRHIVNAALQPMDGHSRRSLALPQCDIKTILPGAEAVPVTLLNYQYEYGDMPLHELITLCKLARYQRAKVLFEIGTYLGGTTLQLAANSEGAIYTLDLPTIGHKDYVKPRIRDARSDVYPEQPGMRFHGSSYVHRISQIFGDSRTFDFSPYYEKVDVVFVDGCHHYDIVHRDSLNAVKMATPGGIVVWHDYAVYEPGVVRALNELGQDVDLVCLKGTSLVVYQKKPL